MMTETNQKRTAVEFDLNTLEPVMDDNSINNTVTAADRMDHYIDMEVKGTGRRPTYKQLEAASKQQKSEPFPRIMMLDYQNEENEQARLASINNAGSPRPRQNTPEIEKVSADNCLSMDPPTENNKTRRTTSSRTSNQNQINFKSKIRSRQHHQHHQHHQPHLYLTVFCAQAEHLAQKDNNNVNAGSPVPRQRTPSPEEIVSRADLACRGNTCVLTVCVCVFVLRRTIVR